jgi:YD repeat-containing protein
MKPGKPQAVNASVADSIRCSRRTRLLALVLLPLLSRWASGQGSPKTGNFFESGTDISYPGGFELKIERVYNSKTNFFGIFGFGWGTAYEEYLKPSGSGVVIHEYGGGADNEFLPASEESSEWEQTKQSILGAACEARDVINSDEAKALDSKMSENTYVLDERLLHYISAGLMPAPTLPVGTILHSRQFGDQTVERLADGFRRLSGGKVETFDANGLLARVADTNGNYVQIRHDTSGRIRSMEDNFGRSLAFVYNPKGLVESIEGENTGSVRYRYNDALELVYARDSGGVEDVYEYDPAGHHNLTSIRENGAMVELISYYPEDLFGNVKSVTSADGTCVAYSYDLLVDLHHKVTVKTTSPKGAAMGDASYEYFLARDKFGVKWTQEEITVIRGERTDTTYNEFGRPIRITRGAATTTFAYNGRGQLTRSETAAELKELGYVKCGLDKFKVSFVRVTNKTTSPPGVSLSNFDYDPPGNLIHAQDSSGRKVSLSYGEFGLVSRLEMPDGTALTLEYSRNLKPAKILMSRDGKANGAVTVTYKMNNEVEKVDGGKTAPAMVKTITESYRTLADLIRPAGIFLPQL